MELKSLLFPNKLFRDVDINEKLARTLAQKLHNFIVRNGDSNRNVLTFTKRTEFYDNRQQSLFLVLENAINNSSAKLARYESSIKNFKKDPVYIRRFLLDSHMNKMRDVGRAMLLQTREMDGTVKICVDQICLLSEIYHNLKSSRMYDKQLNDTANEIIRVFDSNLKAMDFAIAKNKARRRLYKEYEAEILKFLE